MCRKSHVVKIQQKGPFRCGIRYSQYKGGQPSLAPPSLASVGFLWPVMGARTIQKRHGIPIQHPSKHSKLRGRDPADRPASSSGVAQGAIFWRRELSGPKANHAQPRSAHRLRERAMPEFRGMLGTPHGHVHDSRRHLHAGMRILRGDLRPAGRTTGRRRARTRRDGRGTDEAQICGSDFGEP